MKQYSNCLKFTQIKLFLNALLKMEPKFDCAGYERNIASNLGCICLHHYHRPVPRSKKTF